MEYTLMLGKLYLRALSIERFDKEINVDFTNDIESAIVLTREQAILYQEIIEKITNVDLLMIDYMEEGKE